MGQLTRGGPGGSNMAARIVGGILFRDSVNTVPPPAGGGDWPEGMPINPPPNPRLWGHYNGPGSGPPPGGGLPGGGAQRAHSQGAHSSGSWQREVRTGVTDLRDNQNRRKEADRMFVRDLPTVRTKEPWLISLKTNLVIASGRTDDGVVT